MKSIKNVFGFLNPLAGHYFARRIKVAGLTKQLLPIFQFLKLICLSPLTFEELDVGLITRIKYTVNLRQSILVILGAAFINFCFIASQLEEIFLLELPKEIWSPDIRKQWETLHDKFYNQTGNGASGFIMQSFENVSIVIVFLYYVIEWTTAAELAGWLNEWNNIEQKFSKLIDDGGSSNGGGGLPSLVSFRNKFSILYIGIPVVGFAPLIFFIGCDLNYPLSTLVTFVCTFISTTCLLVEDTKLILMFKTVEVAFKRVRENVEDRYGIGQFPEAIKSEFHPLLKEEIKNWHALLLKIRKQAERAGKYMTFLQLVSIVGLIYFTSATLFLITTYLRKFPDKELISQIVSFSAMSVLRLFFNIFMAGKITEEEKRIAWVVQEAGILEDRPEFQNQLSRIDQMLTSQPTEISLNRFVTLNNSLILTVRRFMQAIRYIDSFRHL